MATPCDEVAADADGRLDTSLSGDDNCFEFDPGQADGDGLGAECEPDTDPATMQETTTPSDELPGATACELTGDGVVDQTDGDIIFGEPGQRAQPSDLRDPEGDGRIDVLEGRFCVERCTSPNCEPSSASGTFSCGLLGVEALLVLLPWWLRRRWTRQGVGEAGSTALSAPPSAPTVRGPAPPPRTRRAGRR